MSVNVIVPITSARVTHIQNQTLVGVAWAGTANWWTQRALSDPTLGTWATLLVWGKGSVATTGPIFDGVSRNYGGNVGTQTCAPILHQAVQPWPAVGSSLVSAWAVDDAYLSQYSSGMNWNPTAFVIDAGGVRADWCAGYEGDIDSEQATTGTWLAIEGTGPTLEGPGFWPGTTLFALGRVLAEGTYAAMLAYRDAPL